MNADETKIVLEVQAQLKAASANITKLLAAVVPPVEPPVIVPGSIKPGMFGLTHVNDNAHSIKGADLNAVAKVRAVFTSSFGSGDPMPRDDGQYDWSQIDWSVNRARGAEVPVAIIGMFPGWATGGGNTFDPGANERRPLEQNFGKIAAFAGAFAKRYPWFTHYTFGSELKGFWGPNNTWDVGLYIKFCNLCRDAVRAVNPTAKFIGPYIVLKHGSSLDNNQSTTWRGPGWVGDDRELQTTLEFCRQFKPDVIGVDFAPGPAGFDPLFKFADLLGEAGFKQPILSMETYVGGNPDAWVQALKRAKTYPQGFALLMWGETGLEGGLNNPVLDAGLTQKIKAVTG